MSDAVTHWAWNGISYYPSNVPRVQRGLGNIIFSNENELRFEENLLSDVPSQFPNIKINPSDIEFPRKSPDKEYEWSFLNHRIIVVPYVEQIVPELITGIKEFPSKIQYLISVDDKKVYFFFIPDPQGAVSLTDTEVRISFNEQTAATYTNNGVNPIIIQILPKPPNLEPAGSSDWQKVASSFWVQNIVKSFQPGNIPII